jgi:hypothetical protein
VYIKEGQMKSVRLWATTTPKVYQTLLLYLAQTIDKNGKKVKIGEFVESAVIEKLARENKKLQGKVSKR